MDLQPRPVEATTEILTPGLQGALHQSIGSLAKAKQNATRRPLKTFGHSLANPAMMMSSRMFADQSFHFPCGRICGIPINAKRLWWIDSRVFCSLTIKGRRPMRPSALCGWRQRATLRLAFKTQGVMTCDHGAPHSKGIAGGVGG